MGSSWFLKVSDYYFEECKGPVSSWPATLFREQDRSKKLITAGSKGEDDPEEDYTEHLYSVSISGMKDRLFLLGINLDSAYKQFQECVSELLGCGLNSGAIAL
jgi:hypothetical protein